MTDQLNDTAMKAADKNDPDVKSFFPSGTMKETTNKWIKPYLYTAPEAMLPIEQKMYTLGCYVVNLIEQLTTREKALQECIATIEEIYDSKSYLFSKEIKEEETEEATLRRGLAIVRGYKAIIQAKKALKYGEENE